MATPSMLAMAEVHRAAELELVRNDVIIAKRALPSIKYEVRVTAHARALYVLPAGRPVARGGGGGGT